MMKAFVVLALLAGTGFSSMGVSSMGSAQAGTVDTFTFSEGGFSGAINPGSPGTLTGSFTGTLEANGTIQKADLSNFSVVYTSGGTQLFGYGPASFFSFIPGSDSTLDFATAIGVNGVACTGAAAAFGAFGCGAGGVNGEVAGLDVSNSIATVTLVSSVFTPPPQPLPIPTATPFPGVQPTPPAIPVPEPAALGIFAAAVLTVAGLRRRA